MTIREIDVHITGPERHRWRRLRLDLSDDASREDVLEAVALPLYIHHLSDQPAKALPPALDDLLRLMTHFPTIKHVRDAAKPYAGTLRLRLHRLERLQKCEHEASNTGRTIPELWDVYRRRST